MLKQFSLLLLLMTGLTSCFEVLEDISFKKDGSGVLKLIVNLSQSKSEINSLMKLDSSSGIKIPREKEINAYLDQALRTLKTTDGLSRVMIKRDFRNWVFEIQTEFNSAKSLEAGLNNLQQDFANGQPILFKNKLSFNGKILEREMLTADEKMKKELNKPVGKKVFSKAKYTTIYRFENNVEKFSNKRAKMSPSKKAIMLQSNVLNLINGSETIQNIIKLK